MKIKNNYVNCSRISEKEFRLIIKYYSPDLNTVQFESPKIMLDMDMPAYCTSCY